MKGVPEDDKKSAKNYSPTSFAITRWWDITSFLLVEIEFRKFDKSPPLPFA